ncbi:MAG: zf-TFIIB domain-containing protein [Acidobacteria bacterium]|nr:zf-TFIIB domain-containing protein [Acidobacteriota bacterium]
MTDIFDERRKGLEEEYIHRRDREALEHLRAALREAAQERGEAAAIMQCPRCTGKLHEVSAEGLHLDRCDTCHGIWLDAGELVHLISNEDRAGAAERWLRVFWPSTHDE